MSLLLRNLLWTILLPGTVAGWIPYFLLKSAGQKFPQTWEIGQVAGLAVFLVGLAILTWCIYDFATAGKGTLSPFDPARKLVVRGLYRFVRNPMYVGVLTILIGESLFFQSRILAGYVAVVFIGFNLFVFLHEEPYLRGQFGEEYERYCKAVGRWIPGKPTCP